MPYVSPERRKQTDSMEPQQCGSCGEFVASPQLTGCDTAGQLTYRIQQLLKAFLEERGENYETYSMMLGSLEGAKADLIRRKLEPYEKLKQKENSDVW